MLEREEWPKLNKIVTAVDVIWIGAIGVSLLAFIIFLVARAPYLAWH